MTATERHIALPPDIWGPIFWYTIHIVALGYPPIPSAEQKTAAKQFYESLQYLIPCPICREHYAQHLKDLPVDSATQSRSDLIHWTWQIHNLVNQSLGKRQITLDEFLDDISRLQPPKKSSWITAGSTGILIASLAVGVTAGFAAAWYLRKTK